MVSPASTEPSGPNPEERRRELWVLHKAALDDRNFQVTLNWDRTKHYFVFNTAVLSAAAALSKVGEGPGVWQLGLFLLAALNSVFGAYSINKGREYYYNARAHLKYVESQLGIDTALAMKTTRGMARATTGARLAFGDQFTITNLAIFLQLVIGAASAIAFGISLWVLSVTP